MDGEMGSGASFPGEFNVIGIPLPIYTMIDIKMILISDHFPKQEQVPLGSSSYTVRVKIVKTYFMLETEHIFSLIHR